MSEISSDPCQYETVLSNHYKNGLVENYNDMTTNQDTIPKL